MRSLAVLWDLFPRNTTVVAALRRVARRVVSALGEVLEQKRHDAALLAVPKGLERDHQRGGQTAWRA